jgi:hypothetical protein
MFHPEMLPEFAMEGRADISSTALCYETRVFHK